MKKIIKVSIVIFFLGIILNNKTLDVHIHDTYYIISYLYLSILIILLLLIGHFVFRKILSNSK